MIGINLCSGIVPAVSRIFCMPDVKYYITYTCKYPRHRINITQDKETIHLKEYKRYTNEPNAYAHM